MNYKYRDFIRSVSKQAFDEAEAGSSTIIERNGVMFGLIRLHTASELPNTIRPIQSTPLPYIPPRYPSSTVATGLTAKQKKMALLKEQRVHREATRLSHLNDAGIRYDPIPE